MRPTFEAFDKGMPTLQVTKTDHRTLLFEAAEDGAELSWMAAKSLWRVMSEWLEEHAPLPAVEDSED